MNLNNTINRFDHRFNQRQPLTSLEIREILDNQGLEYTALTCALALRPMTSEAKEYLLKSTELFPEDHKTWISSCFKGDLNGFIKSIENYVELPAIRQLNPNSEMLLGDIVHIFLLFNNESQINQFIKASYSNPLYKTEVIKRVLLIFHLSFVKHLKPLMEASSLKTFLKGLLKDFYEGSEQCVKGDNSYEVLNFEYRDKQSNYLENFKINGKVTPKYFLYGSPAIKEGAFPDILKSLKRVPKEFIKKYPKEFLYHPSITTESLLNYILEVESPSWEVLSYRGVILEEKYYVESRHMKKIQQVYDKYKHQAIKLFLRSTYGDNLYDSWVLKKALDIPERSEDLLDSLHSFAGVARGSQRLISCACSEYFLKNVEKGYSEDQIKEAKSELVTCQPRTVPEVLLLQALDHYQYCIKETNKSIEIIQKQDDKDRLLSYISEKKDLEDIYRDLRVRSMKSKNPKIKLQGVLGVGI